jgi:glutaredoxin
MKKVLVYALSTCPWCRKTKEFFTTQGVPFDYVDYDLADAGTQAQIMEELDAEGATGFPFVKIGGMVVLGYRPDRFAALLAPREART